MLLKTGERWHCLNAACNCEFVVATGVKVDGQNPRCACGALMKKKYISPAVTYLEFLQLEEPVVPGARSNEE